MSNKKMEMVAAKWVIGIFSVVFFMSQILSTGIAYEPPSNTATTYTPTRPALTGSADATAVDSEVLSGTGTYDDPFLVEETSFNDKDNVWTQRRITKGYDTTSKGKTEEIKFKHSVSTYTSKDDKKSWDYISYIEIDGTQKREETAKGTKETKDATVENWENEDNTGQSVVLRSKLTINEVKETLTQPDKTEKLVFEHIFTSTHSYGDHPMNESDTTDIRYGEGKALNGTREYIKYEKIGTDPLERHTARGVKDETGNIIYAGEYWKLKGKSKPEIEYTYTKDTGNATTTDGKVIVFPSATYQRTLDFIQGGKALNKGIWAMLEKAWSWVSWDAWIKTKKKS